MRIQFEVSEFIIYNPGSQSNLLLNCSYTPSFLCSLSGADLHVPGFQYAGAGQPHGAGVWGPDVHGRSSRRGGGGAGLIVTSWAAGLPTASSRTKYRTQGIKNKEISVIVFV